MNISLVYRLGSWAQVLSVTSLFAFVGCKEQGTNSKKEAEARSHSDRTLMPLGKNPIGPPPVDHSLSAEEKDLLLLSDTDPEAALTQALAFRPLGRRAKFVLQLLTRIGQRDPQLAANLAGTLETGQLRIDAIVLTLGNWMKREGTGPAQWVQKNLNRTELAGFSPHLLRAFCSYGHFEEGFSFIKTMPPDPQLGFKLDLPLGQWVENDPTAAREFVAQLPKRNRLQLEGNLYRHLGAVDPHAALKTLEGLSDEELRAASRQTTVDVYGEAGTEALLDDFALPLHAEVVAGWSSIDPVAALKWAFNESPEEARPAMVGTAIEAIAHEDPEKGVEHAIDIAADERHFGAVGNAFFALATESPQAAVDQLDRLPDNVSLKTAAHRVAFVWGRRAPEETASWIQSMPSGTKRDHAIMGIFDTGNINRLGSVNEVASMINDSEVRANFVKRVKR